MRTAWVLLLFSIAATGPQVAVSAAQTPESPNAGRYVSVGDGKLYYEQCGAGNAVNIVLLHDGLLHSITWDDVWQPLCTKYHVLRYDRRGYGRSDAATSPYVPEDDLLLLRKFYVRLARLAKEERHLSESHSIDEAVERHRLKGRGLR